jgi:hypothetical protein
LHTDPAPGGALTPGIVFENLQAFQRPAALKAAIELDVFRAVGQGPGEVASIARHASASERGIRISSAVFLDPSSRELPCFDCRLPGTSIVA